MDDARAALNEARTLSPDAPEIAELENRLGSASSPDAILLAPDPFESRLGSPSSPNAMFLAPDQADVDSDPGWPRMIAGVAVLLVLFSVLGFGLTQLPSGWANQLFSLARFNRAASIVVHRNKPTPSATEGTSSRKVDQPAETRAAEGLAKAAENENPPATSATTSSERITRRRAAARAADDPPSRLANKSARRWPSLESPPRPASGSPSPMLGRPEAADAGNRAIERARLVEEPAKTTASTAPGAVIPAVATAESSIVSIPTPALERTESTHAESERIRSVLVRYENAYNRLDAKAASSVWPRVDQAALGRAFDGLITQRVSLGLCEITVIGNIGGASCAGKAKWEPKIGGGLQTADRYWSFNLRKTDDGWKIEEARVR
jgi:hypothetical protein